MRKMRLMKGLLILTLLILIVVFWNICVMLLMCMNKMMRGKGRDRRKNVLVDKIESGRGHWCRRKRCRRHTLTLPNHTSRPSSFVEKRHLRNEITIVGSSIKSEYMRGERRIGCQGALGARKWSQEGVCPERMKKNELS